LGIDSGELGIGGVFSSGGAMKGKISRGVKKYRKTGKLPEAYKSLRGIFARGRYY